MLTLVFAASVILAAAEPAPPAADAPKAAQTDTTGTKASQPDPLKVICRRQEKVGTNIKIRTCMTRAEWAERDEQLNRFLRDTQNAGALNTGLQVANGPH